jgi:uncharacterized protein YfaS (alpha-2-macroglobulin family)
VTGKSSRVRVISHLFHGAPNSTAHVRWRAVWSAYTPVVRSGEAGLYFATSDHHSPGQELRDALRGRRSRAWEANDSEAHEVTVDGTSVIDANGVADIECSSPLRPDLPVVGAEVNWEVSVTAPDGQTVSAAGRQRLSLAPAQPAVALNYSTKGQLNLAAVAVNLDGAEISGVALKVTLYRVSEKSVREELSRHVVRYRNTPVFTPVLTRSVLTPFRESLAVSGTGRFVATVELADVAASPRASDDAIVSGQEPAEFAQWDDTSLTVNPEHSRYAVGETARIAVRAPFVGRAWVTVETDRVLASYDILLAGNSAYVNVPVTAAMHPNAFVSVHLFRPGEQGVPAERLGSCEIEVSRPETELQVVTTVEAPKVEPGDVVRGTTVVTAVGHPAAGAEITLFAVDEAVLTYGNWSLPDAAQVFFPRRWHAVATHSGLSQFRPHESDDPLFQKGFLIGDGSLGWRSRFVRSRFLPVAFWQASVLADGNGRAAFSFKAPDNLTAYRIVAVAQFGTDAFGSGTQQVQVSRRLQAEPALPRFARNGDDVELRVILRQNETDALDVEAACALDGGSLMDADRSTTKLARALPCPIVFRARVLPDATQLRVRFKVRSLGRPTLDDAVEVVIPVYPNRITRHETTIGTIPAGGWSPASALPEAWRGASGNVDLIMSRSPWLPLLEGLPRVLEYPHGCVEQLSGRVLAYATMADLIRALPDCEVRAPEYKRRVQEGISRLARAQLPNGAMPYWPGSSDAHSFATIQTAWAVVEAGRSGWVVRDTFAEGLRRALIRIVRRQDERPESPAMRAFALMVASALDLEPKLRVEALELFRQRDALGDDGRAFLALALHRYGILKDECRQLVAELDREPAEQAFAPTIFGSDSRTAALRLCARASVAGNAWSVAERVEQQRALATLMASSPNFSTQENLWMLLAFRALIGAAKPVTADWSLPYSPPLRSSNGEAVGWSAQSLAEFDRQFSSPAVLGGAEGTYLLRATYRTDSPESRSDRGFRVERIVRNLTAPTRDGTNAAPFQLGDELAVTFRVITQRNYAYVALEESLPAAFETVDPTYFRMTQRDKLAELGSDAGLSLSHWEKRDDRTLWYFDQMDSGTGRYTAIVRVTSAGRFQWPGATISPMYDARFGGMTDGQVIEVR